MDIDIQQITTQLANSSLNNNSHYPYPDQCKGCVERQKSNHKNQIKRYYWVKSRILADWISKDKWWKLGIFSDLVNVELPDELYVHNFPYPIRYNKIRLKQLRHVFNWALNDEVPLHTWMEYDSFSNPVECKLMLWDVIDNLFGKPMVRDFINSPIFGTELCEPHTCKVCWLRAKSSTKPMCTYCKKQSKLHKRVDGKYETNYLACELDGMDI